MAKVPKRHASGGVPCRALVAALVLVGSILPARADVIGGVDFPQGASSFADAVVDYSPVIIDGNPTEPYRHPEYALGAPEYPTWPGFVSLGSGGSITLQFVDNRLTGDNSSAPDLWIFEVGPLVEATAVEISKDGSVFHSVGTVAGSTRGIDIDSFGWHASDQFAFVRLTDDPGNFPDVGASMGADIDAVGAISSVAVVPEPGTYALILAGLAAIGMVARRRRV